LISLNFIELHLEKAKTQRQVADAGRLLDLATIPDSIDVQERLIKVASIAGLLTTAQRYMDDIVERKHVPSPVCYVAFLQGLRKGGRYPKMQAVLDRLRQVAVDEPLSVLALNTYLAALLEDPLQRSRVDDALTALRKLIAVEYYTRRCVLMGALAKGGTTVIRAEWPFSQRCL
jgi:hypothetical protein